MVWNLVMDKCIFFLSEQSGTTIQATMESSCLPPDTGDGLEEASPRDAGSLDNLGLKACIGPQSSVAEGPENKESAIMSAALTTTDGHVESIKVPATSATQSSVSHKNNNYSDQDYDQDDLDGLNNSGSDSSDSESSSAKLELRQLQQ